MARLFLCPRQGETLSLEVGEGPHGLFVRAADWELQVRLQQGQDGRGWLDIDGRIVPFASCRLPGGAVQIWLGGRTYTFEVAEGPRPALPASPAASQVLAPMPGSVRRLLVEVGATVEAGQTLLILESMKMEVRLDAPRSGRVARLGCAEGDLVETGALLVALEDIDGD